MREQDDPTVIRQQQIAKDGITTKNENPFYGQLAMCEFCGVGTHYCCPFCSVLERKIIWVCEKPECRERHESSAEGCIRTRKAHKEMEPPRP